MSALPLEPFSEAEAAHLARIEAAEPAPESLRERVAVALWHSDVEGAPGAERVHELWPKVCANFPEDAAAYRRLADAALAVMRRP